ncbi:hypothetical protein Tco_1079596 [Tanacetum coccineum]|uniref:Uncharacterized protein n=1 Tax=Tanacetum coccineum TaxID=301880 RepID=A0ABQ5HSA3_9ASTR
MTMSGIPPRQVLSSLHQKKKDVPANSRTIYNLKAKLMFLRIIDPCTGHYTRIDTLSLNSEDVLDNDDANRFVTLVNELSSRYQGWPLHKKEYATLMITNLLNESEIFFEPVVQQPKGRPPTSKKKKGKTSTTRDPSRFEYVESSQTHNPSSSSCVSQRNNELIDESSGTIVIHIWLPDMATKGGSDLDRFRCWQLQVAPPEKIKTGGKKLLLKMMDSPVMRKSVPHATDIRVETVAKLEKMPNDGFRTTSTSITTISYPKDVMITR